MRCLTVTTMTALTTVAIMATLTQEGSSTTNQIPLGLYQVQAGPVGLPHLHLQMIGSPRQTVALLCILMVAAQRMVEMVPGLALVYTGARRILGTVYVCLYMSVHVFPFLGGGILVLKYILMAVFDLSLGFYFNFSMKSTGV